MHMLDIVIKLTADGIPAVHIGGLNPTEMPYQVMIHDYRDPTFVPREDHFVDADGERMDVYPANVVIVGKQAEPELLEDFLLRKLRKWLSPFTVTKMVDADPSEIRMHTTVMLELVQKLEQLGEGRREGI